MHLIIYADRWLNYEPAEAAAEVEQVYEQGRALSLRRRECCRKEDNRNDQLCSGCMW
jgi:hypothetical protein